jgi:ribosomal protein S27AE
MADRTRYCQRCFAKQVLVDYDQPRPCGGCGGTNFDAQPPVHYRKQILLTESDRNFLRANRINPETDVEWFII